MKYVIVTVDDGGATAGVEYNIEAVIAYLSSSQYWQEAAQKFREAIKQPGFAMSYPCGWIFCINNEVEL